MQGQLGDTIPVYLLDTDLPENAPEDRSLTDYLYGGDEPMRLRQEAVLGLGGVAMLKALGAWGEKKLSGKVSMGAVRSTFVFDKAGKLVLLYPKVKAKGHAAKVLEDIRMLRFV